MVAENGGRERPRERRPGWSQGAGDAEDETAGGESVRAQGSVGGPGDEEHGRWERKASQDGKER